MVRDGPQTLPVALYSMRNIKKGSFSIDYLLAVFAQASRQARDRSVRTVPRFSHPTKKCK